MGTDIEPANGTSTVELTEEHLADARERWPDLPEEQQRQRMKLSLIAKARHAQVVDPATGRRAFGGPQPGSGRPSKKRAAEAIAELAQGTRQKEVIDALFSGLGKDNSPAVRAATAEKIVRIEREERALQLKEDEFDGQSKEELKGFVAKGLVQMMKKGQISMRELIEAAGEAEAEEASITDADVVG